jgi:hypothetical protein
LYKDVLVLKPESDVEDSILRVVVVVDEAARIFVFAPWHLRLRILPFATGDEFSLARHNTATVEHLHWSEFDKVVE